MDIKYLEENIQGLSIKPNQDKAPKTVIHEGSTYTYIGKDIKGMSLLARIEALFKCTFMSLASITIIPLFSKKFRNTFKHVGKELFSGKETVKYYALFPDKFSPYSLIKPTPLNPKDNFNFGRRD